MLLLQHALVYGCLGLLVEVLFTGIKRLLSGHKDGAGTTYIYMLPIYGLGGVLLEATHQLIPWPMPFITIIYVVEIYLVEFTSGYALKKWLGRCPWDYGKGKYTIMGLIRLDYWFFWYCLCLFAHTLHPVMFKIVNAIFKI